MSMKKKDGFDIQEQDCSSFLAVFFNSIPNSSTSDRLIFAAHWETQTSHDASNWLTDRVRYIYPELSDAP